MSRAGKVPVQIPQGVTVNLTPSEVAIKGAKGELKMKIVPEVKIENKDGKLWVHPDGTVLKQELMVLDTRLTFVRETPRETAAP